jgi:hypothetical protein
MVNWICKWFIPAGRADVIFVPFTSNEVGSENDPDRPFALVIHQSKISNSLMKWDSDWWSMKRVSGWEEVKPIDRLRFDAIKCVFESKEYKDRL